MFLKKIDWNIVIVFEVLAIVMALLIGNGRPHALAAAAYEPQELIIETPVVPISIVEEPAIEVPVVYTVDDEQLLKSLIPSSI